MWDRSRYFIGTKYEKFTNGFKMHIATNFEETITCQVWYSMREEYPQKSDRVIKLLP